VEWRCRSFVLVRLWSSAKRARATVKRRRRRDEADRRPRRRDALSLSLSHTHTHTQRTQPQSHPMLDRLRTWLDAREDARRRRESQQGSNSVGDARTAAAAAPTPSRRAGLRPRAVAGAKPSATATAASDDAYVLVTVGTTKFEALIECVLFLFFLPKEASPFRPTPSTLQGPNRASWLLRTIDRTRARCRRPQVALSTRPLSRRQRQRRPDADAAQTANFPQTKTKPTTKTTGPSTRLSSRRRSPSGGTRASSCKRAPELTRPRASWPEAEAQPPRRSPGDCASS
jgi:hypothetical protein